MQDEVGYMISAGIETIELVIEHQRNPGQVMPEFGVGCGKCPADSIRENTGLDMIIFGYINLIIEIYELELIDLPVNSKRSQCQKYIDDKFLFA